MLWLNERDEVTAQLTDIRQSSLSYSRKILRSSAVDDGDPAYVICFLESQSMYNPFVAFR